ncbi:MAG TPA: zinc ribbon domain-containing protein [Chitinophagaceae bacterium]|nr:zinc ribbon domain-containing protein [Chitinophagaceae bacterium]
MPYCPNCGTQNLDAAKFCISCGAALTANTTGQQPPPSSTFSQQPIAIGSKVTFNASDGKTYTGTILDIQGDQYKIKYDTFNFETWLKRNQFTIMAGVTTPPVYSTVQQNIGPQPIFASNTTAATPSFVTHLGFWGCILIIIGFFTNWLNLGFGGAGITAFDVLKSAGPIIDASGQDGIGVLILGCVAVTIISAAICLLYTVGVGVGKGAFILFKVLPLLALIATVVYIIVKSQNDPGDYGEYDNSGGSAWKILGIGIYLTLAGSFVLAISKSRR